MENFDILEKLKQGNETYVKNVSPELLQSLTEKQNPYAVILTCSDSRVIPEKIFSADLGELFVIRVAGNTLNEPQLGSVFYAVEHLNVETVVVLGHTNCGAVHAAATNCEESLLLPILSEISASGKTESETELCCLNVQRCCDILRKAIHSENLNIYGAIYDLKTGKVNFNI